LLLYSSYLPLGVPNRLVIQLGISSFFGAIYQQSSSFSGTVAGEEVEDFCEESFRMHILYFVLSFALLYFILLASFYQKPKKLESLVVVFTCLLLVC
jgi:cell division protein FtsW (lipid II flippase)